MSVLVAAAITLPLLGAMYLLKLRRRPLRVSSVILWPEAATDVQVNVPLAPPRASWLLLLHFLIAGLLIAAAGRPALTGVPGVAGRMLVLIDCSAPMSARDGVGEAGARTTRLDEAKRRAKEMIRAAGDSGNSRIAVVSFSATASIVREFSPDARGAMVAVDAVQPTDQPANIASALEVARALLAAVDAGRAESEESAEVSLLSGGSFEEVGKELAVPGGTLRLVRVGPAPEAPKENLGIVVLAGRRDEAQPEIVRLFTRIQNASPRVRAVAVRLSVDGRTIETRSISVPGAEGGPGEKGEVFSLSAPSGGLAMVSLGVDVMSDMLESDDAAAMDILPAAPARALYVRRGAVARDSDEAVLTADSLLLRVLEELRLGELKIVSRDQYEEMAREGGLKFFDIVIFDGVTPRTAPQVSSLSFGAGLPGLELGAARGDPKPGPILSWVRSHPLLRDITLDGVVVAGALSYSGSGAGVEVLARDERGPLLFVKSAEGEPRRVVVAFDLVNSSWPLHAGFPIFVKNAVDFLTAKGAENAGVAYTTVQPVSIEVEGPVPEFAGPTRIRGIESSDATGARRRVNLGVLDRAGVYTPDGQGSKGVAPIAVNLVNAHASAIATSDEIRVGRRVIAKTEGQAPVREIWMWALLAAGALLAVEWLVFARSARL